MGRFETQWLAAPKNFAALADLSGQWIDLVHGRRQPRGIVLDMDSSVSPTHGEQEMSVWNGHYACTCYHPLFVLNQFGDLERVLCVPATCSALTAGTTCSSPSWRATRARSHASIFERTRPCNARGLRLSGGGVDQIRDPLPANQVLQSRIGYLLTRPVGRPPHHVRRFHANFSYQAGTWTKT